MLWQWQKPHQCLLPELAPCNIGAISLYATLGIWSWCLLVGEYSLSALSSKQLRYSCYIRWVGTSNDGCPYLELTRFCKARSALGFAGLVLIRMSGLLNLVCMSFMHSLRINDANDSGFIPCPFSGSRHYQSTSFSQRVPVPLRVQPFA